MGRSAILLGPLTRPDQIVQPAPSFRFGMAQTIEAVGLQVIADNDLDGHFHPLRALETPDFMPGRNALLLSD